MAEPAETRKRVLIVEDDAEISEIVAYNLGKEGIDTDTAADGDAALSMIAEAMPDLILLDLMLPGVNGWEVCRRVRQTSDVSIIMLTARDSDDDKVLGLDIGADDYMTKPFVMKELLARVRANLRRRAPRLPAAPSAEPDALTLDDQRLEAKLGGRVLELSAKQYELLCLLARNPDKVFSREEMLNEVWGYQYFGGTRIVDVAVRRLRERLGETLPGAEKYIATKHGLGYLWAKT